MDAGGKDGAISHVFSGLNPQGVQVTSFGAPSAAERKHDFRSWYEEVLVARVHPDVLAAQNLPPALTGDGIWNYRLRDIGRFECYLAGQGIVVLKFFLHMGKEEQRHRFLARIDEPDKNWKLQSSDIADRARLDDYQQTYEAAIRATAHEEAPWFVLPADRKWLARALVAAALLDASQELPLRLPEVSEQQRETLRRMDDDLL
jgi:polyphosphate kinase 2 (PPK2 family)